MRVSLVRVPDRKRAISAWRECPGRRGRCPYLPVQVRLVQYGKRGEVRSVDRGCRLARAGRHGMPDQGA
jgi:hypothetical protein